MSTIDAHAGIEPAVSAADDPRHYAQLLCAVYDAAMAGEKMPARPRSVIGESWDRVLHAGVDPDVGAAGAGLDVADLEARRLDSGLAPVLDDLTAGLDSVIADGDNILVVADAHGRVLWRSGAPRVMHRADRLGFVEGANWGENAVGTNAIGTALMSGHAVQVFSAEHFVRTHHSWTCAGAPIRDPRTGDLIGVVDVSGPAATIHPTTVALVDVVAKLAEARLRDHHRRSLDQLRSVAAPMLSRLNSPALAVDNDGWVAAVDAVTPCSRLSLPRHAEPGRVWVRSLGECDLDPLPGGWLVRVAAVDSVASETVLHLDWRDRRSPSVTVTGSSGQWTITPSPRHAEILALLAHHPDGCSAAQMSRHLFGADDRTITVRAEMSRLRKHLGGLLAANPYRFVAGVSARVDHGPDASVG
ncbi:helix-turn-helix domain-containing protein [Gordonia aquimaris]|uniref:GAF domain-containing protein n=1 Tax=Gordonia aquimaris TaxID=2984863 RepID=A0A9X3D3A9_9ACTN|nr:helix-turn-helix domain-containing protein [Gordonia aquimaris]MCX2964041.1 GAF domain-containing protein [Gordonia aquimaris]